MAHEIPEFLPGLGARRCGARGNDAAGPARDFRNRPATKPASRIAGAALAVTDVPSRRTWLWPLCQALAAAPSSRGRIGER